jgi:hypothetical protein
VLVVFGGSRRWDFRLALDVTHVEDDATATTVALFGALTNVWFGVYGLGVAVTVGFGDFVAKRRGGWTDATFSLTAFGSPVKLRFGAGVAHELSLDAGVSVWGTHNPTPFGRLAYTVVF